MEIREEDMEIQKNKTHKKTCSTQTASHTKNYLQARVKISKNT
jgi:hypothetical protein